MFERTKEIVISCLLYGVAAIVLSGISFIVWNFGLYQLFPVLGKSTIVPHIVLVGTWVLWKAVNNNG